jgi:hypothetical protein
VGELDSPFAELLDEAERLCVAEELEGPELHAFEAHARAMGPQLSQDDLLALMQAFQRVQERIRVERDRVRDQLAHAGSGRRALKGYGSLRSARMCQRASRRI